MGGIVPVFINKNTVSERSSKLLNVPQSWNLNLEFLEFTLGELSLYNNWVALDTVYTGESADAYH